MPSAQRLTIIRQAMRRLKLLPPTEIADRIDAIDANGKTYHLKYRTEGRLSSLSFDFKPGELDAPYDFFIGLFITEKGEISNAFRVKRKDVYDLAVENADSRRLRWNDEIRADRRVESLRP